ncbi:MAG: epoxyqueuosine reductase, partial [Desulfobacterium sp.]|nr:epoxyqueuosine reductase [Desulfobacterium sp.]
DRCQNVCPRNAAWLAKDLSPNLKVAVKEKDFQLSDLLHMDKVYFEQKIWPHMFYMSSQDIWRWKMNVARVMGNTNDRGFTTDLVKAFEENPDDRVRSMIVWALGKLGGEKARQALEQFLVKSEGIVLEEVRRALA